MSNLTRIQNNQIYDSTIQAKSKIAAGSITGNLLATNVTFNSNITILGNLQVANSYTLLNSVNTYINDPIVVFNNGYVGDISGYDIGILVNRNTTSLPGYPGGVNTFFGWSEGEESFIAIATTETGTTVSSINNSGYANVHIGNLTVAGVSAGSFTATEIVNTPISGSRGSFTILLATTGFSTANALITGGNINSLTTLGASTGVVTNFSSANIVATALSSGYVTATTGLSTSNAVISGGSIDGTPIGDTTASTGVFTSVLVTTGFSTANVLITGGNVNTLTSLSASKAVITNLSTGNARITGGDVNGLTTLNATTAVFTNISSANIQGALYGTVAGQATSANVAYFLAANDATANATYYPIFGNAAAANAAPFTNTNLTFNPSTGTLGATKFSATTVVATDASIGTITATTGFSTANARITGGDVNGLTTFSATTATATNLSSGNIVADSASVSYITATTGLSTANAQITGGDVNDLTTLGATTAVLTNFSTANARITGGYADNFPIGANIATTGAFTTINANANISLGSGANIVPKVNASNDLGSPTNRFKSLWLSGQTLYIGSANISVDANGNLVLSTASGGYFSVGNGAYENNFTANVRSPWHLGSVEGTYINADNGVIGTFTTSTGYASNFSASNLLINHASLTTLYAQNFSTGNARITGGYADNYPIGANTAATGAFTTLTASGQTTLTSSASSISDGTGALVVTGGVGIGGNLNVTGRADFGSNVYINGNLTVTGQSVNIGASSLVVKDPIINLHTADTLAPLTFNDLADIGIMMHYYDYVDSHAFLGRHNTSGFLEWYARGDDVANVFTNGVYGTIKSGEFKAANTTPSTSTTTGALTVAGGAGIAGDLYAANIVVTYGNVTTGNVNADNIYGTFWGTVVGYTDFATKANISFYQDLTNGTANQSYYFPFYDKATGNAKPYTNTSFYVNPNSGNLYAGTFNGDAAGLTGTAWQLTTGFADYASTANYANSSGSAAQADTVAVTATGANADYYLTFVDNAGTNYYGLGSDANLSYNPSTNVFSVGIISYDSADGIYLKATNFMTGNAAISGGDSSFGTLHANNFSTSNARITGSQIQVNILQANNFSTANAIITNGTVAVDYLTANNVSTGNAVITDGSVAVNYLRANNFSTANAAISGGDAHFATLHATNFSTANAAISGGDVSLNTLAVSNFSTANAAISGGDAHFATLHATNFSTANAVISGGSLNNTPIGDTTANTGKFTTLTASSTLTVTGNMVAAATTASTNTTTGALVVRGGAGIASDVYIGGSLDTTGITTATGGVVTAANIKLNSGAFAKFSNLNDSKYFEVKNTGGAGVNRLIISSDSTTEDFVFTNAGDFIANGANSTSTGLTNGALQVPNGGVYVGGNLAVSKAAFFNDGKNSNYDVITRGATDDTLIWARPNSTYDTVVIGGSAGVGTLVQGAKLIINSTDSILVPVGTSAQRPGNSGGTDVTGMVRYSTTRGTVEFYDGAAWQATTNVFTIIVEQQFTGDNSTTIFTLSQAATTASCIVSINGVIQIGGGGYAYTVSGTQLTFSEAPADTDIIDVRILTTTQTIRGLASDNGYMGFHTTDANVYISTGTSSMVAVRSWLPNGAEVNGTTAITNVITTTTIDTWNAALYSSAEYTVTVTDGSGVRTISKILVAAGASSGAFVNILGNIDSTGATTVPGVYSATNASGTVALKFTPTTGTYTVRVKATYQTV